MGGDNFGFVVSGNSNRISVRSGPDAPRISTAVEHLQLGLHAQAWDVLRLVMTAEPTNPDAYFYGALAKLGGRRAFLCSLAQVRDAEQLTRSALALDDRGVFHYFLAYLGNDYYERKNFRSPLDWRSELTAAQVLGLQKREVARVFRLLGAPNPFSADA